MKFITIMPHIWIVPLVAILLLALVGWCIIMYRRDTYNDEGWLAGIVFGGVLSGFALVAAILVLIPFNSKYWAFYSYSGTVQSVTNSFHSGSDGDLTGETIAEVGGKQIVLTDNRIMTLKGQHVDLTCTVSWVPYGADQANCFLGSKDPLMNPYVVIERIIKWIGWTLFWAFWALLVGSFFIAMPILGTLRGWPWYNSYEAWLVLAVMPLCIGMGACGVWLWQKISEVWRKRKDRWDRNR